MTATDEASKLYKEKNPIKKQYAKEDWEQMAKATTTIIRSFRKKTFDKMLPVADPTNGDDFMAEICFYAHNCKILVMYFLIFGFNL